MSLVVSPPAEQFEAYVRARAQALVAFAHAVCGDPVLAEELAQDAIVRTGVAWRRIRLDPEPYTRKIIVRLFMQEARRRGRTRPEAVVGDAVVAAGDPYATTDSCLDLVQALATLPAQQRAAVVLRHYADYSEAETAALLGCSVGTVKSQTHRALSRLRSIIETSSHPGSA